MSKEGKVKVINFKNLPKFQILKETLHVTHFLKLLDKICEYKMDPTNIVEDTETDWLGVGGGGGGGGGGV